MACVFCPLMPPPLVKCGGYHCHQREGLRSPRPWLHISRLPQTAGLLEESQQQRPSGGLNLPTSAQLFHPQAEGRVLQWASKIDCCKGSHQKLCGQNHFPNSQAYDSEHHARKSSGWDGELTTVPQVIDSSHCGAFTNNSPGVGSRMARLPAKDVVVVVRGLKGAFMPTQREAQHRQHFSPKSTRDCWSPCYMQGVAAAPSRISLVNHFPASARFRTVKRLFEAFSCLFCWSFWLHLLVSDVLDQFLSKIYLECPLYNGKIFRRGWYWKNDDLMEVLLQSGGSSLWSCSFTPAAWQHKLASQFSSTTCGLHLSSGLEVLNHERTESNNCRSGELWCRR